MTIYSRIYRERPLILISCGWVLYIALYLVALEDRPFVRVGAPGAHQSTSQINCSDTQLRSAILFYFVLSGGLRPHPP